MILSRADGTLLPEGVATDSAGRPTRDPALAWRGAILPFGGYKGFGLAFVVQAFGVLAGSALDPEKDDGDLFVVFKPDLLTDLDDFKRELSELVARIKATPRAEGVAEIRIPGEHAFAWSHAQLRGAEFSEPSRPRRSRCYRKSFRPTARALPCIWAKR